MSIELWNKCKGKNHIQEINEIAWRMIELQEKTLIRKLVNSLEEQQALEEMMEESKPSTHLTHSKLHNLLCDPFKNPPLKHGSRFGKNTEAAIWYGALTIDTVAAENAYYRLSFIDAYKKNSDDIISIPLILFSAKIKINRGIILNRHPFLKYKHAISSPTNYDASQLLGTQMRENKIDGFTFYSARDPNEGVNIGLFHTNSFAEKNPHSFQTWQCSITKNIVEFTQSDSANERSLTFPIDNFLIDGKLPAPAI